MTMETVYWVTAAASLVAVWLNIKQRAICFMIWAVTNAIWATVDFVHGIHAQGMLQLAYFGLSIYGLVKWSSRRAGKEENDVCEDST